MLLVDFQKKASQNGSGDSVDGRMDDQLGDKRLFVGLHLGRSVAALAHGYNDFWPHLSLAIRPLRLCLDRRFRGCCQPGFSCENFYREQSRYGDQSSLPIVIAQVYRLNILAIWKVAGTLTLRTIALPGVSLSVFRLRFCSTMRSSNAAKGRQDIPKGQDRLCQSVEAGSCRSDVGTADRLSL